MMDTIVLEESSSSTAYGGTGGGGGGRAIDRHNPIIRDEKRLGQGRISPLTSNITHPDQPCHRKKSKDSAKKDVEHVAAGDIDRKEKSVAFAGGDNDEFINDFISPATSSRCLLRDKATFNFSSEFDHVPPPPPPPPPSPLKQLISHNYGKAFKKKDDDLPSSPPPTPLPPPSPPPSPPPTEDFSFFNSSDDDDDSPSSSPPKPPPPPPEPLEFHNYKVSNKKHQDLPYSAIRKPPSPPPPPPPPSSNQVVVLEVSLHCRGCERKMKKHISKMEGVTSFKIEFAAKKVTVVGDVTPLAVLTSVLKVKNAKLLTPAAISSSPADSNH